MIELALFATAVTVWAAMVLFFWRAGAWLPYYILGSAGSAILFVVLAREILPLELALRAGTARGVDVLAGLAGLRTSVTWADPGAIVVIGVPHHQEWTHLNVGLESSGLLEMAALAGLIAFFPRGGAIDRSKVMAVALVATFAANILRVLVIVAFVAHFGQGTLDFVHVFLGRAIFFAMAVVIYWYAITRPTLKTVGARLHGGAL
ncbi:MAG: archaeosortase/exosortase family protein [Dehalococcoidia bacterium]|nr:exosortase/archaeosortase family protein [Dehalococcoidia bacterium]NUQ54627.1 archaeosortase/exosortase family protein [Dehalococcoidia bacterium]